jgi:hypothetical protein
LAAVLLGLGVLALALPPQTTRGAWPPDEKAGPVDYSEPKNWPRDPGFAGQWEVWSFAPSSYTKLDARTRRLGLGGHYDRAWARTQGDPRVVIAVLDSGIYWERADLVNKIALSAGELPQPADACQKPEHRGDGKRVHDANGDGVFNVQDYTTATLHEQPTAARACDPRVRDSNGNGLLDAQDLIRAFSDRVDDDKNGYVDDIAGWDFFRNDNDAYDETRYGHGTGEAMDSGAEADNGIDDAGVCPRCRILPLRVGDSFVADANDFALAVTYAVDSGAAVVQEALGTLSNSPLSRWAIDYAYDNHVTVIASAADENSFHHNFPGTNNHTVYVHAIRANADKLADATHAFAFNNCTNYGAQLQLSVPGNSCSSEATGKGSGMAGLLYSAALQADLGAPPRLGATPGDELVRGDGGAPAQRVRRLTAEEVRQLMITSVDGFYDPGSERNPAEFPTPADPSPRGTKLGFTRRFGYGRVNARSAVDAVLGGALPPQVEIESPEWFQVLGKRRIAVSGRIQLRYGQGGQAPGRDTYDFTVEWAPGVDPKEADWQKLGGGELLSQPMLGALADLPADRITVKNTPPPRDDPSWQPDDPAHLYTLTVRVRATQHSTDPSRDGLVGEARRSVHLHADPDLLPGFPLRLGASGEASLKAADLDGDGKRELIVADSGGLVHALRADGSELAGWPVSTPPVPALREDAEGHRKAPAWALSSQRPRPGYGQGVLAAPAVGDVDGDGKPDVVVATYDGAVLAIAGSGRVLAGFPVSADGLARTGGTSPRNILDDGFFAAPVLVDLDRDGRLDIVAAGFDGQVYAWHGDGSRLAGWPVAVADPQRPDDPMDREPRQRARILSTPAAGDLSGDGIPDLVLATNEQYGPTGRVYALDGRGTRAPRPILPGWPVSISTQDVLPVVGRGVPNAPALGDVDGDKVPEVFIAGIAGSLEVLRKDGTPHPVTLSLNKQAFGKNSDTREFATLPFIASPALGDLDGDGRLDAILPTTGANAAVSMARDWERLDFEHHIVAWDVQSGKMKPGFPRVIEDYTFFQNPLVVDIDADGDKDVVAGSAGYFVHAWDKEGNEAAGFPKLTGGWIASSAAVGDLDGDGRLELAAVTRNGWLFVWKTRGRSDGRMDWDSFHHDLRNTGNLAEKLDQGGDAFDPPAPPKDPGEPPPVEPAAGCSCQIGERAQRPGAGVTVFALLLLGVYVRGRRRVLAPLLYRDEPRA